METNKLIIYVIMHKLVDLSKYELDSYYRKLMVGQESTDDKTIMLDSKGDNISYKNKNYCELTGLYWIWKNTSSQYVGLCHYRRFFVNNGIPTIMKGEEALKILEENDIILPVHEKTRGYNSVYDHYKNKHCSSDLDECRDIINNLFPEYIETYDKIMNGKMYYQGNMFIMPKKLLDQYCEWIFTIFEELEKRIDLTERDSYQKRAYGFLSERLFTVWVAKNKLKVYETFVKKTDDNFIKKVKFHIKIILKKLHLLWILKGNFEKYIG